MKVKSISKSMSDITLGRSGFLGDICHELEKILNEERATVVEAPRILTGRSDPYDAMHIIISYEPNTNNGHVKVGCALTKFHEFCNEAIVSDYPVSVAVAGQDKDLVVAVWTETEDVANK